MEVQEEIVNNKNNNNIAKGKRTKRQRFQSPIPFANLTANSSSGDGDRDGDGDGCEYGDACTNGKILTNMSPTSSQEFQDSTQEEEDMANCLILLAQGHINNTLKHSSQKQDAAGVYNPTNTTTAAVVTSTNKFNSRRFLETGCPGSGKAGYYVYECKTCNRTFPSFQALGGHRASHKKPKNEEKKQFAISSDEEAHLRDISSLSFQLNNNNNRNNRVIYSSIGQNKAKIHECSICGAEFNSGQALGGHMRRHRTTIGANSSTTLSLTPMATEFEEPKKARNLVSLELDLNLPAPEADIFSFASKKHKHQQQKEQQQQQKPSLVFSGPTLVDCHY